MTIEFTERSEIERGFADIFRDRIAPHLEALGAERARRQAENKRRWKNSAIAAVTLLALSTIVLGVFGIVLSLFVISVVASVYFAFFMPRTEKHTVALTELVMSEVCGFLGLRRERKVAPKSYYEPFERLGLVVRARSRSLSHHLAGSHRGIRYEAMKALLRDPKTKDERAVTHFNGVLARIEVPVSAPVAIAVVRDYGEIANSLLETLSWGRGSRRGGNRVDMGDAEFERRFVVYCEDPELARRFVTPGFMRALVVINDTLGEGEGGERHGVSGAFEGDTFYLAISRRSGFLSVDFVPDETLPETIHVLFADMTLLREVIDLLHEN